LTKQLSLSENQSRLSATSTSLSTSSKIEPTNSSSPLTRTTSMNTTPKLFVYIFQYFYSMKDFFVSRQNRGITLYPCTADNDTELSFHANETVIHSELKKVDLT
jgi:hypothetical protein